MKRVAVLLSGCGVFDGAEIHESVLTLLHLDRAGAEITCTAPNKPQRHVINHLTGKEAEGETRNVLVEAARIARGKIVPLDAFDPLSVDAIMVPGGFGAAKNLSSFAVDGASATVDPAVAAVLSRAHAAGKVLGFFCIAPAIAAQLFGGEKVQFTIGNDQGTAAALESWGGRHCPCAVDDVVVDRERRVVTSPAYMLAGRISEADAGIGKFVRAVLDLA